GGARCQRLTLALDVHQALPAGADRVEQRMVAEPRNRDADLLGRPDHQGALGHGDLVAVDGHGHHVGSRLNSHHTAHAVEAAGSNGQPPFFWCRMISSLKYFIAEVIGTGAASPSAQKARPTMLSPTSRIVSRSSSVPSPSSSRWMARTSQ